MRRSSTSPTRSATSSTEPLRREAGGMTLQDAPRAGSGEPGSYVFDPGWDRETDRLLTNEAVWDPGTLERFERLGVAPGWSCLEVGAGAGGAARWLADRVGPTGRVVAADLEVGRLAPLAARGVEVRR